MKLRPQFNLRFRDVEQFEKVMDEASKANVSMNEWIVLQIEAALLARQGK
jgi:predicted HicB family RNase H-like nuclease